MANIVKRLVGLLQTLHFLIAMEILLKTGQSIVVTYVSAFRIQRARVERVKNKFSLVIKGATIERPSTAY